MPRNSANALNMGKSPSTFSQTFPPAPTFTEKDLPPLSGKCVLITGATSGIGLELAKMVYSKGANVHITGRSSDKLDAAAEKIRRACTSSKTGEIRGWILDLEDLPNIKRVAGNFLNAIDRLDLVVHNAGLMKPPKGSRTKFGHDLEMGTNCLGPYLLNNYLGSRLKETASSAPPGSVRIIWTASMIAVATAQGGIVFDDKDGSPRVLNNVMENYMQSKVGNVFLAVEMARKLGDSGVISLSVNPGLLKTNLNRHAPKIQQKLMAHLLKPAIFGAYTELWAAFSPEVTTESNGGFIVPWGRFGGIPPHIERGLRSQADGGTGLSARFVDWCERETQRFQ